MCGMAKQQLPSEMKALAGLRLRAARLTLGIQSQNQMADDLGVTGNAYNNYETGARLVDVALAVRLLELTGIGPDWIYAGSTTGVPFDRARSLQTHLQQLKQAPLESPTTPRVRKPPKPKPKERPPKRPFKGGSVARNPAKPDCDANVAKRRVVRLVEAEQR